MRYGLLRLGKKSILTNYLKQTRIIVLSFVIVIIIGALLLSLPAAPTLRNGAKGSWVRKLQERLEKHGYDLDVDGSFGPATLSAAGKSRRKP